MKIYTITLNPAYDVHAYAEHFTPFHENLANVTSREAGGKGVNLSRALQSGGTEHVAIVVLGKDNCAEFKLELDRAGLQTILLEKPGRIRENLTLHCADQPETRISFSGFPVDDSLLDEVSALLDVDLDTVITFTGRVASGMSMDKVKAFLKDLQKKGAKIVLDSKSFSLEDIFEVQPWLMKPNQEEISEYLGCEINSIEQAIEKTKIFADHGVINVMVSLGEQGALLLHRGRCYIATPPAIDAISTIGAGDSSLAGFIAAAQKGENAPGCLKTAVAYGTAACLTAGTVPPRREELKKIYQQVYVKEIEYQP
jgi:1-phosphofructokinase family hexose kinase